MIRTELVDLWKSRVQFLRQYYCFQGHKPKQRSYSAISSHVWFIPLILTLWWLLIAVIFLYGLKMDHLLNAGELLRYVLYSNYLLTVLWWKLAVTESEETTKTRFRNGPHCSCSMCINHQNGCTITNGNVSTVILPLRDNWKCYQRRRVLHTVHYYDHQVVTPLLLILAGDVETNPGPGIDADDTTILDLDDISDVMDELKNVLSCYHGIGGRLHLPNDKLEEICGQKLNAADAMHKIITEWLKQNYSESRFELPTWKALADAVEHHAGGDNRAEAEKIAHRHKKKLEMSTGTSGMKQSRERVHKTDDESDNGPPSFFRQHQGIFIRLIDISTGNSIIPKLLSKRLLTDDEYQTVTLKTEIENKRKQDLSDILYDKPPWVPWIVLDCLQDLEEPTPHHNHILLADKLKRYLDQQWPEISKLLCSCQIQHIHSVLDQRNIMLDRIIKTLKDIFVEGKMQIQIPVSIGDFPSLILFLHKIGLCNDLDNDILCKLLVEVSADDLKEHLKAFSDARSDHYIDTLDPIEPPSEFFLAHTFHSSPRVTYMQLFYIKDIFAHFLKIPRYSFSCTACKMEDESTILVWQFPVHVCNYLQTTYDSNCVFKETLSKVCIQDIKIIKDDAAVRQRKRRRNMEGSSTSNECETGSAIKVSKLCDSGSSHQESSPSTTANLSSITVTESDNFIKNLKATYMDTNFFKRSAGPLFGRSIHFINLALIKKQGASDDDKLRDKFLRDSLHGLVEDIMKKKVQIAKHEIFSYGSDSRKLVLVEGSPGVGKTMLAMKLCQDWAKGEILSEYNMVILVTLRRFRNRNSLQLKDLISIYSEGEFAENMAQKLLKSGGAKTLIILEGWDELPPVLREEMSFFSDLILANKLPKASIMVTSRPTVSGTLYDYMDERHIEVLGFKPKQITEYIQCHCSQEKADLICTHLQRFPNLKALAHIPLTLSIICKVIRDEDVLPSTLTELYNKYICQKVYQAVKKKESELTGLNSIEELKDEEMKIIIKKLCEVALDGLVDKCYVFNSEDLRCTVHGSFDGYGLLNVIQSPANAGCKLLYQFIHLSIQEFLAAYHIQELPNQERLELLKNHREDKQFQNVWKFLAGITKLKNREFQDTIIYNTNQSNKSQLFLIHCLYEAHNSEICSIAARKLQWTLNLNNMSLNTTDCLCAAYTVTSAGGTWTIDLRACNIGEDGLEIFKQHLVKSDDHESTDFSIKKFNLIHNHITVDACRHLADILRHNVHIAELHLASNKFGDEGVKELCDVLSKNKTISVLQFSRCGLTSLSGRSLAGMLRENTAMKELFVSFEKLGDDGVIPLAEVVAENKTLSEITLSDTQITIKSLKEFQKSLNVNNTFKVIRLDRNELTAPGARIVANMIIENSSLVTIDLSKNPIGDEGFGVIMDALIAKPSGSLENIGFSGCGITSKGLPKLVKCFQVTKTFKKIQLGYNKLGDEGAKYIIEAVTKNESQSIISIRLVDTGMSRAAEKKLEELHMSVSHSELDINFKSIGYFNYKYSQDKKTSMITC